MLRFAVLSALLLAAGAVTACDGGATRYEVTVQFNTSYTQDDLDEVEAILHGYDDDLDFLIQESFPPTGVARLKTDESGFCSKIIAELEAKPYVRSVDCNKTEDGVPASESPDEPVSSTPDSVPGQAGE